MKHKHIALAAALPLLLAACSRDTLTVQVSSQRNFNTDYEIVEIDGSQIASKMRSAQYVVTDSEGIEVPYQLTYDNKLIFPVSVAANASSKYKISKGNPTAVDTIATGRFHPERHDDMAWENDKIGFRAYGPESQRLGDRLYGYDIFLKRDTSEPILDRLYALNEDPVICARIDSLNKAGNREEASRLSQAKSYHIDHGNGMDCYAVGPTLGAATSAIVVGDSIAYPWCFESYEVLDNGPLRFTMALNYPPQSIGADEVTEHRLISLDAGTHLNRTTTKWVGIPTSADQAMTKPKVITGIVVHDGDKPSSCEASNRYIAYADPTQGTDNGEIYIGAVFIDQPDKACIATNDGITHVAAFNTLGVDNTFTYYWGAGWDRSDIPSWQTWLDYLSQSAAKIQSPLQITLK